MTPRVTIEYVTFIVGCTLFGYELIYALGEDPMRAFLGGLGLTWICLPFYLRGDHK